MTIGKGRETFIHQNRSDSKPTKTSDADESDGNTDTGYNSGDNGKGNFNKDAYADPVRSEPSSSTSRKGFKEGQVGGEQQVDKETAPAKAPAKAKAAKKTATSDPLLSESDLEDEKLELDPELEAICHSGKFPKTSRKIVKVIIIKSPAKSRNNKPERTFESEDSEEPEKVMIAKRVRTKMVRKLMQPSVTYARSSAWNPPPTSTPEPEEEPKKQQEDTLEPARRRPSPSPIVPPEEES
ncbi:hypothetical protein BN14_09508 [Rhizoctonia solani AG-1 IB]|uniref:Uncharacterized protein n=1 Tax=Thanatephorus cucumeris (strain AG1-IB / isolate 7/3/14) TaxID=1108050 RepID=M5C8J1_THACB|nr:hypothetical protein BN14_09508 [Rhizoctonia solani AG-1 IB]